MGRPGRQHRQQQQVQVTFDSFTVHA
jgi:hypothetical protein